MLRYGSDMKSFLIDLKTIVTSIIVKQTAKASQYETLDIKKKADRYLSMVEGGVEWGSFVNFDLEVLQQIGIDSDLIDEVLVNKELIPFELRNLAMTLQRKKVIDEYVEENQYYRMMNGEPALDDTDVIVVGPNSYGVRPDVPITNLYDGEKEMINNSDLLDILVARYPSKGYIQHLGGKAVPYYKARRALNYDILFLRKAGSEELCNEFVKHYANARNYVMRGLYNPGELDLFSNYDGFMGMVILVMAINRTLATIFSQGIEHNFYDDNLIKDFFKSYNIPYHETIAIKYQKELAKKLNLLLQKKSSNQVLFDIVSLFDYNQVNIYEYHLVKDYFRNDNGDPMIRFKEIIDENGDLQTVLDYEKTYDIYFQKVNIRSENKAMEITDPANRLKYHTITGEDPYWVNDADLITKLYTNKYNSVITKYLSIDVAFDITQLIYETCHSFRLIFDRNAETKSIKVTLPWVNDPVSLYDLVTFVCALVAKKFNLKGEIPLDPWNVAQVYGFNFKTDLDYLRNEIIDDIDNCYGEYSHVDPALLKLLKDMPIVDLASVKAMYYNIEALRVFLDTAMRNTQDLEAYEAYKKIYNSVLITTDLAEVYTKSDGSLATSFYDLLSDRRPDLAKVLDDTPKGEMVVTNNEGYDSEEYEAYAINTKINKCLDTLADVSEELDDLRFVNEKSDIVANIEKIINQMKSYTVDQQAAGIIYLINDPHMCMLKILDFLGKDNNVTLETKVLVDSILSQMRITHRFDDKLSVEVRDAATDFRLWSWVYHVLKISDKIYWEINALGKSNVEFFDSISRVIKKIILPRVDLKVREKYFRKSTLNPKDFVILDDHGEVFCSFIDSLNKDNISIDDFMSEERVALRFISFISVRDKYFNDVKIFYKDALNLIHEIWKLEKGEDFDDGIEIFDYLNPLIDFCLHDTIMRDKGILMRQFRFEDYMWLINKLSVCVDARANQAIELLHYMAFYKTLKAKENHLISENYRVDLDTLHIIQYMKFFDKLIENVIACPEQYITLFDMFNRIFALYLKHGIKFHYKIYCNTVIYDEPVIKFLDKITRFFKENFGVSVIVMDDLVDECVDLKQQIDAIVNPKIHYWDKFRDYSYFITVYDGVTIEAITSIKAPIDMIHNFRLDTGMSRIQVISMLDKCYRDSKPEYEEFILFDHIIVDIYKEIELDHTTVIDAFVSAITKDFKIAYDLGMSTVLDTYKKDNVYENTINVVDKWYRDRYMIGKSPIYTEDSVSSILKWYKEGKLVVNDKYWPHKDKKYYMNTNLYDDWSKDVEYKSNQFITFDYIVKNIDENILYKSDKLFDLVLDTFNKDFADQDQRFDLRHKFDKEKDGDLQHTTEINHFISSKRDFHLKDNSIVVSEAQEFSSSKSESRFNLRYTYSKDKDGYLNASVNFDDTTSSEVNALHTSGKLFGLTLDEYKKENQVDTDKFTFPVTITEDKEDALSRDLVINDGGFIMDDNIHRSKLLVNTVTKVFSDITNEEFVLFDHDFIKSYSEALENQFELNDDAIRSVSQYNTDHILYLLMYCYLDRDIREKVNMKNELIGLPEYNENDLIGLVYTYDTVEIIRRNKPLNIIHNTDKKATVHPFESFSLRDYMTKTYID